MKIKNIQPQIFQSSSIPKRLDKVLIDKKIGDKTFCVQDIFIKNISKNKEIASTPIVDFLGNGTSAIAFETKDGKVLKLSRREHYPLFRPIEDFDVPIFKKGKAGKIHYYFEEKLLQHGLDDGFILEMRDMIKEKGYAYADLGLSDIHQIGISERGTLHLIDPECARFKTIFHAIWKKFKMSCPNKLSFSRFSKALHK